MGCGTSNLAEDSSKKYGAPPNTPKEILSSLPSSASRSPAKPNSKSTVVSRPPTAPDAFWSIVDPTKRPRSPYGEQWTFADGKEFSAKDFLGSPSGQDASVADTRRAQPDGATSHWFPYGSDTRPQATQGDIILGGNKKGSAGRLGDSDANGPPSPDDAPLYTSMLKGMKPLPRAGAGPVQSTVVKSYSSKLQSSDPEKLGTSGTRASLDGTPDRPASRESPGSSSISPGDLPDMGLTPMMAAMNDSARDLVLPDSEPSSPELTPTKRRLDPSEQRAALARSDGVLLMKGKSIDVDLDAKSKSYDQVVLHESSLLALSHIQRAKPEEKPLMWAPGNLRADYGSSEEQAALLDKLVSRTKGHVARLTRENEEITEAFRVECSQFADEMDEIRKTINDAKMLNSDLQKTKKDVQDRQHLEFVITGMLDDIEKTKDEIIRKAAERIPLEAEVETLRLELKDLAGALLAVQKRVADLDVHSVDKLEGKLRKQFQEAGTTGSHRQWQSGWDGLQGYLNSFCENLAQALGEGTSCYITRLVQASEREEDPTKPRPPPVSPEDGYKVEVEMKYEATCERSAELRGVQLLHHEGAVKHSCFDSKLTLRVFDLSNPDCKVYQFPADGPTWEQLPPHPKPPPEPSPEPSLDGEGGADAPEGAKSPRKSPRSERPGTPGARPGLSGTPSRAPTPGDPYADRARFSRRPGSFLAVPVIIRNYTLCTLCVDTVQRPKVLLQLGPNQEAAVHKAVEWLHRLFQHINNYCRLLSMEDMFDENKGGLERFWGADDPETLLPKQYYPRAASKLNIALEDARRKLEAAIADLQKCADAIKAKSVAEEISEIMAYDFPPRVVVTVFLLTYLICDMEPPTLTLALEEGQPLIPFRGTLLQFCTRYLMPVMQGKKSEHVNNTAKAVWDQYIRKKLTMVTSANKKPIMVHMEVAPKGNRSRTNFKHKKVMGMVYRIMKCVGDLEDVREISHALGDFYIWIKGRYKMYSLERWIKRLEKNGLGDSSSDDEEEKDIKEQMSLQEWRTEVRRRLQDMTDAFPSRDLHLVEAGKTWFGEKNSWFSRAAPVRSGATAGLEQDGFVGRLEKGAEHQAKVKKGGLVDRHRQMMAKKKKAEDKKRRMKKLRAVGSIAGTVLMMRRKAEDPDEMQRVARALGLHLDTDPPPEAPPAAIAEESEGGSGTVAEESKEAAAASPEAQAPPAEPGTAPEPPPAGPLEAQAPPAEPTASPGAPPGDASAPPEAQGPAAEPGSEASVAPAEATPEAGAAPAEPVEGEASVANWLGAQMSSTSQEMAAEESGTAEEEGGAGAETSVTNWLGGLVATASQETVSLGGEGSHTDEAAWAATPPPDLELPAAEPPPQGAASSDEVGPSAAASSEEPAEAVPADAGAAASEEAAPVDAPSGDPAGEAAPVDAPSGDPAGEAAPVDAPSGDPAGKAASVDAPSGDLAGEAAPADAPSGDPAGEPAAASAE